MSGVPDGRRNSIAAGMRGPLGWLGCSLLSLATCLSGSAAWADHHNDGARGMAAGVPRRAEAVLKARAGSQVSGKVTFTAAGPGIRLTPAVPRRVDSSRQCRVVHRGSPAAREPRPRRGPAARRRDRAPDQRTDDYYGLNRLDVELARKISAVALGITAPLRECARGRPCQPRRASRAHRRRG